MPKKGKGIYQQTKKRGRKCKKIYEENCLKTEKESEDDRIPEKRRTRSISSLYECTETYEENSLEKEIEGEDDRIPEKRKTRNIFSLYKGKITEVNTRRNKIARRNQWLDLPYDLVSHIAEALGLIDLMSFRGVCKEWRSASSKASAQIESLQEEPWFLLYGEGSCECSLLSNQDKIYTLNMPELVGATCLISRGGWLLLFAHGGSMFFLCPFSRARIELPKCPLSDISGYLATFLRAPTSPDCIVAVYKCSNDQEWEVHWLRRGNNLWSWRKCRVDFTKQEQYIKKDKYFLEKNIRGKLGLEANVSVSTCRMIIPEHYISIQSENFEGAQGFDESRHLKGVWIQPRFFQIAPDQGW